jgi:hypothetical protein
MLHLGFVSAILAEYDLEYVLKFASEQRFKCVEVMCWPTDNADARRYAGFLTSMWIIWMLFIFKSLLRNTGFIFRGWVITRIRSILIPKKRTITANTSRK